MRRATDMRGRAVLAAGAALLLSGCADSLTRSDQLWPFSGDAVAANKIAQTIDPWPQTSRQTAFATNGARIADAIARSKTNKATDPAAPPVLVTR